VIFILLFVFEVFSVSIEREEGLMNIKTMTILSVSNLILPCLLTYKYQNGFDRCSNNILM